MSSLENLTTYETRVILHPNDIFQVVYKGTLFKPEGKDTERTFNETESDKETGTSICSTFMENAGTLADKREVYQKIAHAWGNWLKTIGPEEGTAVFKHDLEAMTAAVTRGVMQDGQDTLNAVKKAFGPEKIASAKAAGVIIKEALTNLKGWSKAENLNAGWLQLKLAATAVTVAEDITSASIAIESCLLMLDWTKAGGSAAPKEYEQLVASLTAEFKSLTNERVDTQDRLSAHLLTLAYSRSTPLNPKDLKAAAKLIKAVNPNFLMAAKSNIQLAEELWNGPKGMSDHDKSHLTSSTVDSDFVANFNDWDPELVSAVSVFVTDM